MIKHSQLFPIHVFLLDCYNYFLIQVKTYLIFDEWVQKFRHHRLYRQHELNFGTKDAPKLTEVTAAMEGFTPVTSPVSPGRLYARQCTQRTPYAHHLLIQPLVKALNKNNLNFHPLEVVSRYRDPQLQVGEKTHIFF